MNQQKMIFFKQIINPTLHKSSRIYIFKQIYILFRKSQIINLIIDARKVRFPSLGRQSSILRYTIILEINCINL